MTTAMGPRLKGMARADYVERAAKAFGPRHYAGGEFLDNWPRLKTGYQNIIRDLNPFALKDKVIGELTRKKLMLERLGKGSNSTLQAHRALQRRAQGGI